MRVNISLLYELFICSMNDDRLTCEIIERTRRDRPRHRIVGRPIVMNTGTLADKPVTMTWVLVLRSLTRGRVVVHLASASETCLVELIFTMRMRCPLSSGFCKFDVV